MKAVLDLSVQYLDEQQPWQDWISEDDIHTWVSAALAHDAQITVCFVDATEARILNQEYRGKNNATNVLTFNYNDQQSDDDDTPEDVKRIIAEASANSAIQADIILCGDVILREATEQKKSFWHHTAHLIIHGVLHAQGYDHLEDDEAQVMEAQETQIMLGLGLPDPYTTQA